MYPADHSGTPGSRVSSIHELVESSSQRPCYLGWSTLDESIWKTLRRDVDRVGSNVRGVLLPWGARGRDPTKPLREWDLWGPLFFVLLLGICLSTDSDNSSKAGGYNDSNNDSNTERSTTHLLGLVLIHTHVTRLVVARPSYELYPRPECGSACTQRRLSRCAQ